MTVEAWLPRASARHERGEHLRRSFEQALEGRAEAADPLAALAQLESALAELRALPDESRAVLRRALALPDDVAVALRALL